MNASVYKKMAAPKQAAAPEQPTLRFKGPAPGGKGMAPPAITRKPLFRKKSVKV